MTTFKFIEAGFMPRASHAGLSADRQEYQRHGVLGNGAAFPNAHEIEVHHHYNGGGSQAFGGAKDWPVVSAEVAFQAGEERIAHAFAAELAEFIDGYLKQNNR